MNKYVAAFLLGNYGVGCVGLALSIETCFVLNIALPTGAELFLITLLPIVFYTHTYRGIRLVEKIDDIRGTWYCRNRPILRRLQIISSILVLAVGLYCILQYPLSSIVSSLPILSVPIVIALLSMFYTGFLGIRGLRHKGYLKPFYIGIVWGVYVTLIPVLLVNLKGNTFQWYSIGTMILLMKNVFFCGLNAMLFDVKDYQDDQSEGLNTFAVQLGIQPLTQLIIPILVLIGSVIFAYWDHVISYPFSGFLIWGSPFLLLITISLLTTYKRSLWYYLFVVDGVLIIKAVSGILVSFCQ